MLVGRPYIFGPANAGALGVAHVIRLLRDELEIAMALCGCRTLADITPRLLAAGPDPADGYRPAGNRRNGYICDKFLIHAVRSPPVAMKKSPLHPRRLRPGRSPAAHAHAAPRLDFWCRPTLPRRQRQRHWQALDAAAAQVGITAIVNEQRPRRRPSTPTTWRWSNPCAAGGRCWAMYTSWGGRDSRRRTGRRGTPTWPATPLDGFFIDEMASDAANLAHYTASTPTSRAKGAPG